MKSALNHSGQDRLFDPALAHPVILIGAGSVGSAVAMMLAKIGVTDLTVYDADRVRSHNVPSSVYGPRDVGKLKVEVLARWVMATAGLRIKAVPRMYAGEKLKGAVIACVDTMEARKLIWNNVKGNALVSLYVDTRVAERLVSVFFTDWTECEAAGYYEHHLYPTSQTATRLCGRHGFKPIADFASAIAVNGLTQFWAEGKTSKHIRLMAGSMETIIAGSGTRSD